MLFFTDSMEESTHTGIFLKQMLSLQVYIYLPVVTFIYNICSVLTSHSQTCERCNESDSYASTLMNTIHKEYIMRDLTKISKRLRPAVVQYKKRTRSLLLAHNSRATRTKCKDVWEEIAVVCEHMRNLRLRISAYNLDARFTRNCVLRGSPVRAAFDNRIMENWQTYIKIELYNDMRQLEHH